MSEVFELHGWCYLEMGHFMNPNNGVESVTKMVSLTFISS